eukprot:GILK01006294.1.p1 GENE.GILK01006294.1~~GILK01006294.1.p1  ORF type:complete len:215 (-),score=29.75 GILK01006294.1:169-762(-)
MADDYKKPTADVVPPPLHLSWVPIGGASQRIGLCELPGRKSRGVKRDLESDIAELRQCGTTDIFVLNTLAEMKKEKVADVLFEAYKTAGFTIHHFPMDDGTAPTTQQCIDIMKVLLHLSESSSTIVVHCLGGLGRTGTVVSILLRVLDSSLSAEDAIARVRDIRGPSAIQTVKQFNFIYEFDVSSINEQQQHPSQAI